MFIKRVISLLAEGEAVTHPDEAREVLDALGVEFTGPLFHKPIEGERYDLWEVAIDSEIPVGYADTDYADLGDPDDPDEYTEDVLVSISIEPEYNS